MPSAVLRCHLFYISPVYAVSGHLQPGADITAVNTGKKEIASVFLDMTF